MLIKPELTSVSYYPSFDGLRAIAIALVFLFHFNEPVFSLGWIGVDLFFVLSGFLITAIIVNTVDTPSFFRNFYSRRMLRIFPVYYLVLLISFIILPPLFKLDCKTLLEELPWYLFYLQNFYDAFHGWSYTRYLNHLWTLAIEEQFYLIWPLVVFLNRNNVKRLLSVTILSVVMTIVLRALLIEFNMSNVFLRTFTFVRVDSLLIGSLFAILYFTGNADGLIRKVRLLPLFSIIAFLIFLFTLSYDSMKFASETLLGISFALLVFYLFYSDVAKETSLMSRLLKAHYFQLLGKWSYGFYVFHFPIILIFRPKLNAVLNKMIASELLLSSIVCVITFAITLLLSALSYNFFEKKFLKLKDRFSYTGK